MNYENILFEMEGGIARITLNRPDKLNSFTVAMHNEVADAMSQVESAVAESTVRVLVISGSGRGFCAGQDLSQRVRKEGEPPPDLGESLDKYYGPLVRRLRNLAAPVVIGVNGVAAGAGANLALAGDIVIARESASFIEPFCRLGLLPDTGGTYFLPRLIGPARAMGLALLGDKLPATKAAEWGLIWEAVPDAEFDARLDQLARHFAAAPTLGLAAAKRALNASLSNSLEEQLNLERDLMRELGRSADYAEGVSAFMNKRQPEFRGR